MSSHTHAPPATVPMFGRTRVYSQPPSRRDGSWNENQEVSVSHHWSDTESKWNRSSLSVNTGGVPDSSPFDII